MEINRDRLARILAELRNLVRLSSLHCSAVGARGSHVGRQRFVVQSRWQACYAQMPNCGPVVPSIAVEGIAFRPDLPRHLRKPIYMAIACASLLDGHVLTAADRARNYTVPQATSVDLALL
jgi:hypothetical protein